MGSRGNARGTRLADQIQKDLAEIVRTEMKDPRLGLVTLTGVELSADHSHATVFFTTLGGTTDSSGVLKILSGAAGFMRTLLAKGMRTRTVPELHFKFDASVERGVHLSRLIDDAVASDRQNEE